jgi:hypothetical protein
MSVIRLENIYNVTGTDLPKQRIAFIHAVDTVNKYSSDEPYMLVQTVKVSNGFNNTEVERNGRIFSVLIFLFFEICENSEVLALSVHFLEQSVNYRSLFYMMKLFCP